jgi:hypothetical protein
MRTRTAWLKGFGIFITLTLPSVALARDIRPPEEVYKAPKKEYSPYVSDHFPDQVLFGDTRLHSSWSSDAGMLGATLGPDEAYRVSRGEEVRSHLGYRVKLKRPLDYIALADHAENFGVAENFINSTIEREST